MLRRALVGAVVAAFAACGEPPPSSKVQPLSPDPAMFESAVYPVLLTDCAFSGCHGDAARFMRVHGPGRTRLEPDTLPYEPATPAEVALAYTRATSMLTDPAGPRRGLLLRKPLAVAAGGAEHGGADPWGNNVYATKRDPRWQALYFWALTAEGQAP